MRIGIVVGWWSSGRGRWKAKHLAAASRSVCDGLDGGGLRWTNEQATRPGDGRLEQLQQAAG